MRRKGPMPDMAFRLMTFCFKITDMFSSPSLTLNNLGIKTGDTVIDYGCGPGRYIKRASQLVGQEGKVYAIDIHHLAIAAVQEIINRDNLGNVTVLQASEYSVALPDQTADLIYAFDMFHTIIKPNLLLQEIHRLVKHTGKMFINPGHQSVALAREKILASGLWNITDETGRLYKCSPVILNLPKVK